MPCVLFVEDHDIIRSVITRALKQHGWNVIPSKIAVDAIPAGVDVILTDWIPDGPDMLFLASHGQIPIVVMTGDHHAIMDSKIPARVIAKPAKTREIVGALTDAIENVT